MGALSRSAVLGLATGGRATLALAVPVLAATRDRRGVGPWLVRAAVRAAVVGELVGDKLPTTPSRLERPVLVARVGAGAAGALGLALTEGRPVGRTIAATLTGAAGAFVGSHAGHAWRGWAAQDGPEWLRPDLRAALAEDALVLSAAARLTRG
ncbi:hypothetical protein [Actinotalea sp. K2]|uniref:hypothetical protein n=1 Tax=Actinotalea sp. K2 TaxID=2939438 RepID=UPI0020181F81|nr:hypothetical protein [Actinotalea sp. K2]MCL3859440.1 hypothetical protein [Actinotalea sp. K2]